MRNARLWLVGCLIVLFGSGLAIAGCSSSDSSSDSEDTVATSDTASGGATGTTRSEETQKPAEGSGSTSAASRPGEYVDYSPDLVESTPGEKLLFFHANWCSQCQALEADIESSGVPDGVTVFKVDYDSNQDLRQKYGVTIQTTVVKVDDNGDKIDSYVAYEEPTLDNVAAALLR